MRYILLLITLLMSLSTLASAQNETENRPALTEVEQQQALDKLQEPMYKPLLERYILDELKAVRQDQQKLREDVTKQVAHTQLDTADRALTYTTDTINNVFFIITITASILVLVGWNSLRDIKERVGAFANDEIRRITTSYEKRLDKLEDELHRKSRHIAQAQEEIELTNEIHSLWLKASQENTPQSKIAIYDQILQLRPDDVEALTYKADAALLLGQAQWATSLANRALEVDPENSHALYQRACAHAESGATEEALRDLQNAIDKADSLRLQAGRDISFESLLQNERFLEMVVLPPDEDGEENS